MRSIYAELVAEGTDPDAPRCVKVDRRKNRAVVTLDDPDRLNVLSAPLVQQLKGALVELAADPEVRSIVLTGAGRGFSAGGDLRMMKLTEEGLDEPQGSTDIWRWIRNEFGGIVRLIARTDKAFIASHQRARGRGRLGLGADLRHRAGGRGRGHRAGLREARAAP